MLKIDELSPVKVNELLRTMRLSSQKAAEVRKCMLDVLAVAYESDDYIPYYYFDRANDLLSKATNMVLTKHLEEKLKGDNNE